MRIFIALIAALLPLLSVAQIDLQLTEDDKIVVIWAYNSTPESIVVNGTSVVLNTLTGTRFLTDVQADRKSAILNIESTIGKTRYSVYTNARNELKYSLIRPWTSILPPLIAVILALILKEVVFSLFTGIMVGSFLINGMRMDGIWASLRFIFDAVSDIILNALNDSGHLAVIIFSVLIGGMVSLITKNGGMMGILDSLGRYAVSRKKVQLTTYLLGIAIFFDDYANTLIVGNTMRGLTDRFKISREKLAYLVDSTAAPIAAIAFITTWIGAELGFIGSGMEQLVDYEFATSPYHIFLQSLKYSFYPILTLIFIYILIRTGLDYGPMLKAEERSVTLGQVMSNSQVKKDEPNMEDLSPVPGAPRNWHHAFWPVVVTIFMTILGLIITGMESAGASLLESGVPSNGWMDTWSKMGSIAGGEGSLLKAGTLLGLSDSYTALLWSSFAGLFTAVIITVSQKTMSLWDTSHWAIEGFKTMIPAVVILILAWSLASTTRSLGTADFMIAALGPHLHPAMVPVIIFILAFAISFATGSSWSTMAILYPLAIPLSWKISLDFGFAPQEAQEIMLNCIATVLAASVLGDHCSPISDTTILSSLASDCNHLDHVRTQMPYAATVGVASLLCVGLSAWIGGAWWLSMLLMGIATGGLFLFIKTMGRSVNNPE